MKRLRGEKLGIERPRDWRGREKGAARNGEAEKGDAGTGLLVIESRDQGRGWEWRGREGRGSKWRGFEGS